MSKTNPVYSVYEPARVRDTKKQQRRIESRSHFLHSYPFHSQHFVLLYEIASFWIDVLIKSANAFFALSLHLSVFVQSLGLFHLSVRIEIKLGIIVDISTFFFHHSSHLDKSCVCVCGVGTSTSPLRDEIN